MKRRASSVSFLSLTLLSLLHIPWSPHPVEASPNPPASPSIGAAHFTAARLLSDITWLASSHVGLRANGSTAADSVARSIAARFTRAGLESIDGKSYLRGYRVASDVRVEGAIGLRDLARGYGYGRDWAPLGFSADGHDTVQVAFVGYGISAPEHDYDDYAGLDVSGRLVVALMGEPDCAAHSDRFEGCAPTLHANAYAKARNAADHGAAALVLVPRDAAAARLEKISTDVGFVPSTIPVLEVTRAAGAALLTGLSRPLDQQQAEIDRTLRPRSELLSAQRVEFLVELRRLSGEQVNVAALAPGESEEVVLVCAAYDAPVASPRPGSSPWVPGAIEEAAALATLLAMADVLPSVPREFGVVLAAVSGEAQGGAGAEVLRADLEAQGLTVREVIWLSRLAGEKSRPAADSRLVVPDAARLASASAVIATAATHWRAEVGDAPTAGARALETLSGGAFVLRGGAGDAVGSPDDTVDRIDPASCEAAARLAYRLVLQLSSVSH